MPRFVVEADGGSRGNPGPAGYGAVVLDPVTGETLAERAEFIGVATNNVAEYRGLIAGLKAARELAADAEVRVRMDSKLVVEQMSGRWKIKHPDMKPLAAEAATVLPRGQVTYEWIPRERNKHADRLANEAMDAGRRGGQWEPSASTADLPPQGPPGDAAKGAAAVRAAMASGGATRPAAPADSAAAAASGGATRSAVPADSAAAAESHPAPAGTDVRAAHTAAGPATPSGPATPGTATADVRAARSAAHGTPSAGPAARDVAADLRAARTAAGPEADTLFGEAEALAPVAPAQTPAPGSAPAGAAAQSPAGLAARGAGAPAAAAQPRATAGGTGTGWGGPDMGAPATFVLLRHGETALTPQKRFSGSGGTDPELSEAGRRQAAAVAEALAARGTVQAVVSSPLRRCRETAQAVADRLGLPVTVEEGLRETDFGAWEGLTFAEVRERFPDDLQAWLDSPKAAPTGGGESFAAVTRRVSATRDRLLSAYAGRTVLLVTHVTPVKTLVRLALGAPPESLFKMELSAASLSAVAYYADGNTSVRLLNDTSHLR
ncbi:putative phosphoglycerate mutase [Streptomyces sp. 3211.6]|uniref:bifunctional RNase H/acid phosphatase n=1 Tax=Streptomyces sp. 3211.6 TaxID=1938845 RepID=UPI000C2C0D45|nr:bifunctional RNase H/acid phosphatase [Streptomyces sp. 3211.6]RKT04440.1 putative phosphoglycerate mutase [Streptomyces sp. 3211.6]